MARTHTVKQGECLASIARKYGFRSWRTIYRHADNAALRALRPDPFVLCPGDAVAIPGEFTKALPCGTAQRHEFTVRAHPSVLRIKLRDDDGAALGGKPYELEVAGEVYPGTTAADGLLVQAVPADAERAALRVWLDGGPPEDHPVTFALRIGHLDPVETLGGAQDRLRNLGHFHTANTDAPDDATRDAVAAFQARCGLAPTGELDDATRGRLDELAHRA